MWGHNPQSLILFAFFSILPHTKVQQANTSMINSSDFHLRWIKSASECAFENNVRSKPLKSFFFPSHHLKLSCLPPEF